MANTLRFKRGLVAGIPTAALGEPLFTTDTFDLYIGNGTGNTRFQKYIASGATTQILRGDGSLYTFPLNISSPSNGQVLKYDGTNWVNSADAGVTGSGTAGQVTYWGSSSTITGSNNLFWDATNNRLGIGLTAPRVRLHALLNGNASNGFTGSTIIGQNSSSGNSSYLTLVGAFDADAGIVFTDESVGYRGRIVYSNNNEFMSFWTDLSERMRIHATGNLSLNSTSDNGLRFQVTGDGFFSGSVGIGTSSLTGYNLRVSKNITGGATGLGVYSDGQIQSDVTSARYFQSVASTQAASFTINTLSHYVSEQGTFGASSVVTSQYGFNATASLTGATNNYGFFGNIASGTGRWNLYMNGTAANFLNGQLSVGTTATDVGYLRNYATIPVLALQNPTTGTAVGDGFQLSVSGSLAYIWQYENSSMLFGTNATERMRLDASGNLGLGTASPLLISGYTTLAVNGSTGGNIDLMSGGVRTASWNNSASECYFGTRTNAPLAFTVNSTEYARFFATTGNLRIGTSAGADAGFRLDVNGTMRVSGASTLSGGITLGHTGGVAITFPGGQAFRSNGGIFIDYGNGGTGDLVFRRGAGVTNTLTLAVADGAATFSSSVTAQTGLFGGNLGAANQRVANFRNSGGNGYIEIQGSGTTAGQIISDATGQLYFTTNATAGTAGTTRLFIDSDGDVAVNTLSPNASAILQADSTTKGFLPPRMTTTQRNAITTPAAGLIVYDTTDNKHYGYNGTTWNAFY